MDRIEPRATPVREAALTSPATAHAVPAPAAPVRTLEQIMPAPVVPHVVHSPEPESSPAPMAVAELLPIVESSGLKLAQTDPAKLAAAQARMAAQESSIRVGRERPVLPPIEGGELKQVETREPG